MKVSVVLFKIFISRQRLTVIFGLKLIFHIIFHRLSELERSIGLFFRGVGFASPFMVIAFEKFS
jgi:hypothetical protein